jgi:hypothetical protein
MLNVCQQAEAEGCRHDGQGAGWGEAKRVRAWLAEWPWAGGAEMVSRILCAAHDSDWALNGRWLHDEPPEFLQLP